MSVLNLKFPTSLFCLIANLDEALFRKWNCGNSLRDNIALRLDGNALPNAAARHYTFTDLVRVMYVELLRHEYGVTTSRAIQIANAAFCEIAASVIFASDAIAQHGFIWGDDNKRHSPGPWLIVRAKRNKLTVIPILQGEDLLTICEDAFTVGFIANLHILTQRARIALQHDSVEAEVRKLWAQHQECP